LLCIYSKLHEKYTDIGMYIYENRIQEMNTLSADAGF
jgi:hypothetical protein